MEKQEFLLSQYFLADCWTYLCIFLRHIRSPVCFSKQEHLGHAEITLSEIEQQE